MFDLAIIGAGPAGYVAAERAGKAGLSVVLFEGRELGGVCLNEGCIPTKTLLYGAKIHDQALAGAKYGVITSDISFDYARMVDRKNKVVRKLVAGVGMQMREAQVELVKGAATILGRDPQGIEIECEGQRYVARKLLVCSGSEAFIPPIEGLKEALESGVGTTARELLASKERPESIVIIGGGVIGMEFASLYCSLGTRVSVVEMQSEILGGLDGEISAMLREIYAKRGVEFHLSCKVARVAGKSVQFLDTSGSEHAVEASKILVCVGRRAVTAGFGLEKLSVEMDRGAVKVDVRMRTSAPDVWAAGDVTGFSMLAHTASREAEIAVSDMLKADSAAMSYDAIPGVVYTNPEVASVGLTLAEAEKHGLKAREMKLPMAFSGRFVAENEGGVGLCKIVVEEGSGRILGAHILGNPASEIIANVCVAIEQKMTAEQLASVVFPHPSVAEIIKETLL